ncbi:MAG: DUF1328 domain-containing protein [Bdellovibrionales bacterium]|nr:DUF1328 domain-containing protein [Bdellovibrionales bacterium]
MMRFAFWFFVVAAVVGAFGFSGIAGIYQPTIRVLFVALLIVALVLTAIASRRSRGKPRA